MIFAGASAGLDMLSGLFGYLASEQAAALADSRGRMLRLEAEAEAQRYGEQARGLRAQTKLAYLKSGVALSGSPLDVLDADMLTAQENISAIQARGAADQLDAENQGAQALASGRNALLSGITGGIGKLAWANYKSDKTTDKSTQNRKDIPYSSRAYTPSTVTAGNARRAFLSSEGWQ
jgi:hypothetical protein